MNSRRAFITALAMATAAAPTAAWAQPSGHTYRIGWLAPGANLDNIDAFRAGLRALGFVEGANLTIEPRYAGATPEALAIAAADLVLPRVSRLGLLYEPRQRTSMVPPMEAGARSLGFQLLRLEAGGADDIDAAFSAAVRERVGVVMPVASALFHAEKQRLVRLAAKHRLPTIYENRAFPEAGGLMSYGPDLHEIFRRAAMFVDRILKGSKPADLPVEQPTKLELVINLKVAKALGLTIPQSLFLRADRLIQ